MYINFQSSISCIVYLFALIGFISVFLYGYKNRTELLPTFVNGLNKNILFTKQENTSELNLFLKHMELCPECFLFLFTNKSLIENHIIFDIFNNLPSQINAIFYPRTMKLYYNQPIPYYRILAKNATDITIKIRQYWIDNIKNFSNIKQNSILDFLFQSLNKPIDMNETDYLWPNKTKLILYYTRFFGNQYWYNKNKHDVYSNDFNLDHCPLSLNACHITIDHNDFLQTDASLIHLRESINYAKLNSLTRQTNQRFIFFLKESPVHSPVLSSKLHGHIFNYTQTYRPDSDITATTLRDFFWLFNYKIYPNYDFQSIIKTKENGKILVAIVSNCGGTSNRLKYIHELKKSISVDIYGSCGQSCPHNLDCRQYVYSKYKFYLAFENSLCDEYVTEKFFFALHSAKIVPVVLGWARYDDYIPSNGYIDVRNFPSPKHLAEYIDYLNKNTTAYLEYFRWRQYALHIKLPKYMCELCLKLFLDDREKKTQKLEQIHQYWNRQTQCHSYTKDQNGLWIMK